MVPQDEDPILELPTGGTIPFNFFGLGQPSARPHFQPSNDVLSLVQQEGNPQATNDFPIENEVWGE